MKPTTTRDGDECVLLIGDEAGEVAGILGESGSAADEPIRIEWLRELPSGIERLRSGAVGAVVLDLTVPNSGGLETFDKLFQAAPRVPILVVCGADAEETAKEAVQRGARDYVVKNPSHGYRLRRTVRAMLDSRAAEATFLENEVANMTLDSIARGRPARGFRGQRRVSQSKRGKDDRVVPPGGTGAPCVAGAQAYRWRQPGGS